MFRKLRRKYYEFTHPVIGEVLQFHRVTSDVSLFRGNNEYEITPERFEKLIAGKKDEGNEFISMKDLFEILNGEKEIRNKFVCFTFDDGYKDNFEVAYPILKKYDCPFTIFVATDNVERKSVLWRYAVDELICKNDSVVLSDGTIYSCKNDDEKKNSFDAIDRKMSSLNEFQIKNLLSANNVDWLSKNEELMMDEAMLLEISKDELCTIGSHTQSHCHLSRLEPEEQRRELSNSKHVLESMIGKDVWCFAYPYGDYSEVTSNIANEIYGMTFAAWGGGVRQGDGVVNVKRVLV
ncbi:MAG: polysaccharide deacetylase family protein [Bacteroidia bacterium]|nr:polysaccharide deacetylase family protein [Bacteroidia bacterium]